MMPPRQEMKIREWILANQVAVDELGGIFWPEGEDLSPEFLLHHSG
ncbi:DUF2442 domain-containing protein [Desulfotignum phosphitoxidans]|uniref:Putative DUF2442 domain-containing protein n=1 Tax=Desulfotignum phosphitoxidans DSM 13687 TaxID=1286635 RepID=S0FZK3_9BACT|nr:DUF2442 domain-containing protein [Desulfotignum phosphitoxidans]EMS77392.1 putative DUF2442 domain-containing protein [Desulfotignum phosphitoxidans DSM 13687]